MKLYLFVKHEEYDSDFICDGLKFSVFEEKRLCSYKNNNGYTFIKEIEIDDIDKKAVKIQTIAFFERQLEKEVDDSNKRIAIIKNKISNLN